MGHCDVCSDVCRERITINIITLQGIGFLDALTRLVYLIIVPNGLFVSRIHCLLITFLSYFISIIILIKLLIRIHMVSFITVLNGIVGQFVICCFLSTLAHLSFLSLWLNESFHSVVCCLFWHTLVCLDTVPNECISPDNRIHI